MAKKYKQKKKAKRTDGPDFSQRLKKRFPEFEAAWNKIMREAGHELVNFIRERITGNRSLLTELSKFRFKFVVDTNFVFGQILGAIENNRAIEKTLIYRLLSISYIQLYAPPLLSKEVHEKISLVISQDRQEVARGYATMIISRMEVKDAQWMDEWKTASRLIGQTDADDVAFLALALETESHAIISFDDVFHRQGEIQVWEHGDMDKVITNYSSGFVSFVLLERTGLLVGNILSIIFKFILDMIKEIAQFMLMLVTGAVKNLAKIPWPVWAALIGLGILFKDEIAQMGKDVFAFLKEKGNKIVTAIREMAKEIYELLKGFLEVAGLAGTVAFEFLGYLLHQYNDMNEQLKDLKFDKGIDFMKHVPTRQAS